MILRPFFLSMRLFLTRITTFLLIVGCFFSFTPVLALAQGYGLNDTAQSVGFDTSNTGSNSVESLVNKIVSAALALLALVFFILTIYSGIVWMTARGNDEVITGAKDTLQGAIIGLVIVSLSYAITKFIFSRIG